MPASAQAWSGVLQRKCACGTSTIAGDECAECGNKKLQRKLSIGASNDPLEQEADRVADQVLATPAHSAVSVAVPSIQRFTGQVTGDEGAAPPSVDRVLAGPGSPLDVALQQDMEQRFGQDFSHVRVHFGSASEQSAREVNAHAYTVGPNIVFGAGRFSPGSHDGRRLLAHELTHVIQQSGADRTRAGQREEAPGLPPASSQGLGAVIGPVKSGLVVRRQAVQQSSDLAKELQSLIDGATWKEIRKRVYPKESAGGVQRAKERKSGKRPDLSGLGRIKTLEKFATAVRSVQTNWTKLSVDDRVKDLGNAGSVELKAVDVPGFLAVDKKQIEFKGFFTPSKWSFTISKDLVSGSSLSDPDAAEVANTTLHEARHAEQGFLAARFSAGAKRNDAAAIVVEQNIPQVIADAAVAKKFDAKTDATVAALGKHMYQADVTDSAKNKAISDDDGFADLAIRRTEAQTALGNLKAGATTKTIAEATAKRDALRSQITVVEQKYTLYRNIPYEADAHEVGDAAEQAFRRWL